MEHPMEIYILRHAIAEVRDSVKYADDSERPLTKAGLKLARKVGRALTILGIKPATILSNPY